MKIFRTMIFTDSPKGELLQCDTIEHDGGLWLVPQWLEAREEGYQIPARIIRIDIYQHQRAEFADSSVVLNHQIPQAVLEGKTAKGFVVIERPNIRFPIAKGTH